MADRLEYDGALPYQQRKNLFLKHARYWNHVILQERIDLFLALNVPHETFDYVIYALCKLHGVPTQFFYQSQVPDTALPMNDWELSTVTIRQRYAELMHQYEHATEDEIAVVGRFKRDFERQTSKREKPTPFYMNSTTTPAPAKPTLKARAARVVRMVENDASFVTTHLLNPKYYFDRLKHSYAVHERARLDRRAAQSYEALASTPDLNQRFIYLALHYQPELTTSPLAGAFVDQWLIAQLVAATMPADVHLYVKEHPMQQKLVGRYVGFYDELRRLPRTQLVPRSFDTYELIDRSSAIATATGTAGWEGLYRCKPVLLFGHPFYQYATGVYSIRSTEQCVSAMQRIFSEGFRPTRKDIKLYLKALEDTTVECYLSPEYGKVSSLSEETNRANLGKALREHVRALCSRVARPGATVSRADAV
jgi:hypothetical protein